MPSRTPRFGSLCSAKKALSASRQRLGVAQLAVDDDAVVERGARGLDELRRLAVADAGGGDLGAADLEADELLAAAAAARERGSVGRDGRGRGGRRSFGRGASSVSTSPASHSFEPRLNERSRL